MHPSYTPVVKGTNAPVVTGAPGAGSVSVPVVRVGYACGPGGMVAGQAIAGQPAQASQSSPTILMEGNTDSPELPVSPNPMFAIGVPFFLLNSLKVTCEHIIIATFYNIQLLYSFMY